MYLKDGEILAACTQAKYPFLVTSLGCTYLVVGLLASPLELIASFGSIAITIGLLYVRPQKLHPVVQNSIRVFVAVIVTLEICGAVQAVTPRNQPKLVCISTFCSLGIILFQCAFNGGRTETVENKDA